VFVAPLLALYGLITGRKLAAAGERPRLPYLALGRVHSEDRPHLARAGKAAEQCIDLLLDASGEPRELGEAAAGEVASEVQQLVQKIYELGEQLAQARAYTRRHDPDEIARKQADLELQLEEAASSEERASLSEAMEALQERARHTATVRSEVRTLAAQLTAACNVLETLQARLSRSTVDPTERSAGTDEILADVRRHQHDAGRALEAYAATARELNR